MSKLLSVIVPSYNMEKYLPKCLGSLIIDDKELLQRLDVIVVNDGSKDRTSEIAHKYEAKYPGVFRVIDKPNGHYGSCVNAGLAVVSGKYVRVLDADDYVNSEMFAGLLRLLEGCRADVVITGMCTVDPDGRILEECVSAMAPARIETTIDDLHGVSLIWVHQLVYRRSVFDGGWYKQIEGQQYTDCQWSGVPMLRVRTMYYYDEPVSCYLVGRDGQSMDPSVRVRSLSQQVNVDLYLASIYARGRPDGCARGAWEYFERLTFRELGRIYELCIFGVAGVFPAVKILDDFILSLQRIEPALDRRLEGFPFASTVCVMHKLFVFRFVKSYNVDPRWLFVLKRWLYLRYVDLRKRMPR